MSQQEKACIVERAEKFLSYVWMRSLCVHNFQSKREGRYCGKSGKVCGMYCGKFIARWTQTFFLKWAAVQICCLSLLSQPYCHCCCCSASSSQPPLPPFCFFFAAQLSLLVLLHRYTFFFAAAAAGASSSFLLLLLLLLCNMGLMIHIYIYIYIKCIFCIRVRWFFLFFGIMGIMIHICLMSLESKFLYMGLMSLDLNLGWFWWICSRGVQKTHQSVKPDLIQPKFIGLGRFLGLDGLGWVTKIFFIVDRIGFGL